MIKFPKDNKQRIIEDIQQYFLKERDEAIGNLAAEFLLDFIVERVGPILYNQAIDEAQTMFTQKMAVIEEEFYTLKRPIKIR